MTRREAREQAFVLLFEESFHEDETLEEMIRDAAEGRSIEVDPFAYKLAEGALAKHAEIDEQIEAHSTKWKKNRISRVALAILRLAAYELLFEGDIPDKVSINEAVELAKKFGSDEDSSFVNGVLGGIVRKKNGKSGADAPQTNEAEPEKSTSPEIIAELPEAGAIPALGADKPDEE